MVVDNFRTHQAKAVQAKLGKLKNSFAYTSCRLTRRNLTRLNEVWRHFRRILTGTVFFKTMKRLLKAVAAFLAELATQPDVILNIIAARFLPFYLVLHLSAWIARRVAQSG